MNASRPLIVLLLTLGLATLGCNSSSPPETKPAADASKATASGMHSHDGGAPHSHGDGEASAHSDHSPKHGGLFFMAANNFHHLEGTLPEAGLFRLYLYDDHTQPLSVAGTSGHARLSNEAEGTRRELVPGAESNVLDLVFDPPPPLPVSLVVTLNLVDPKTGKAADHQFFFNFKAVGAIVTEAHLAPGETHPHASPHGGLVVSVGEDLHFELTTMGDVFALWVLDVNTNTLPIDSMTASLTVQRLDGTTEDVPLQAMGGHFMASSPIENTAGATVLAQVSTDGRARIGRFTLPSAP